MANKYKEASLNNDPLGNYSSHLLITIVTRIERFQLDPFDTKCSYSGDGVIVLRDATEGATAFASVDHYGGLTLPQLMAAVEHLSAVHAAATAQLIQGSADDKFEHLLADPIERLEALSNEMSNLLRLFGRFLRIVPGYREQAELFEKYRSTLVSMLIRSLRLVLLRNSSQLKVFS